MSTKLVSLFMVATLLAAGLARADELTQMIQQDLTDLGYEVGEVNGELSTKTIVAISKFQAEHDLEVTGEVTPQLVGIVKAAKKNQNNPGNSATASAAPAARTAEELRAAQQACIQEKVAQAQASQKKKRGLGSLMRAVGRTATRFGGSDLAGDIAQTSRDIYDVNATSADLQSAAKDLGISESELEACRNP